MQTIFSVRTFKEHLSTASERINEFVWPKEKLEKPSHETCRRGTCADTGSLESLECRTGRYIMIATSPSLRNLAKCNDQSLSPLYNLPPEIRMLIFESAALPYANPNDTGRIKYNTNLLLSCRRVWLEANGLFDRCERRFYFDTPPSDESKVIGRFVRPFSDIYKKQHHIHYYGPTHCFSAWTEAIYRMQILYSIGAFRPERFTCTLRIFEWSHEDFLTSTLKSTLRMWLLWLHGAGIPLIQFEIEGLGDQVEQLRTFIEDVKGDPDSREGELCKEYQSLDPNVSIRFEQSRMELQGCEEKTCWSAVSPPKRQKLWTFTRGYEYHVFTLTWKIKRWTISKPQQVLPEPNGWGRAKSEPPHWWPKIKVSMTDAQVSASETCQQTWKRQNSLLELVDIPEEPDRKWEKAKVWPVNTDYWNFQNMCREVWEEF